MATASNKFGSLSKASGVVDWDYNPFDDVLDSHSPSFSWLFGAGQGLPFGYSVVLHGLPRSGKSVLANDMIARLHEMDPEALAIKYDTELRSSLQSQNNIITLDKDRLLTIETNRPSEIFDHIEKDVVAEIQAGKKIRAIVIDSLNNIAGIREADAKSVEDQQIGDLARTLGQALKRILPVIRRHKIALICTAQARAEMNQIERMRGNEYRVALASQALHLIEYQIQIIQNKNKDGKVFNVDQKDLMDKNLLIGNKIRAVVTASSASPAGRTAEFTLDYQKGIVNIGEETMRLGTALGIIKQEGRGYIFADQKWPGWDAMIAALETDLDLRNRVIEAIKKTDQIIRL